MYKIAICDDDKRYRKTIREIIEHENSLPENEIRFYANYVQTECQFRYCGTAIPFLTVRSTAR